MSQSFEQIFESYSSLIDSVTETLGLSEYTIDNKECKGGIKRFNGIDEIITDLSVEEYIDLIKSSGIWSIKGFKQEDLDAILMLNIEPLIMKLFLTFALGELGQERFLSYLNDESL